MAINKKPKGTTLEDLAGMVKRGFDEAAVRVDKRFDNMEGRMDGMEGRMGAIEKRMGTLEKGQEEIKLRLDNVAYWFELVELQRRVEVLEKKVGAKK